MTDQWARLIAILGFAAAGAPALADQPVRADVTGEWAFESVIDDTNCTFEGSMSVAPDGACRLTAVQTCAPEDPIVAKQTCQVRMINNAVLIDSEIVSVEGPSFGYHPDNFTLRFSDPDTMSGVLRWIGPSYRTVFTREEAAIS